MSKIAFLFPGQNSQQVGMGKELCEVNPDVKARFFDRADEILGFGISRLCFEGPEEELVKTENQQPAIFLVSTAVCAVLRERGIEPEAVAGHSLGEYAALVAAEAFSFDDGLQLTRRRGELMAEVAARSGGIMAAILGLGPDEVEDICREASSLGVVEVANFNSPAQTVISGEEPAVRQAMEIARGRRARRVVQLHVSAPFHCRLMAPLASIFEPVLTAVSVADPVLPVVANVTADYERTGDEARRNLLAQLASSVRWTGSVQRLIADGFDTFVEVGPEHVLTGLMKSIDRGVTAYSTENPAKIEHVVAQVHGYLSHQEPLER